MFLVDTELGRIVEDEEIKDAVRKARPYGKWLRENKISLAEIDSSPPSATRREYASLVQRQKTFGYTQEDLDFLMGPMAAAGDEPRGSMGTDTPLAVLSDRPQLPVQLLQAALRSGHEPGDRSDPGRARDELESVHRG